MANIFFELDRLRVSLQNKGLDHGTIEGIIQKASREIHDAAEQHGHSAMQQAIESGVAKNSADFINELNFDSINMQIATDSGNMDFSTPPYPMLPKLLQGAKPIKDGSGVYKVIPIGKPGVDRPKIANNIYDAWKQLNTERAESAKAQYSRVAPKGSKTQFRTATSKQDANTQWVLPAKEKDFSDDVSSINKELGATMDELIRNIISDYEESF